VQKTVEVLQIQYIDRVVDGTSGQFDETSPAKARIALNPEDLDEMVTYRRWRRGLWR